MKELTKTRLVGSFVRAIIVGALAPSFIILQGQCLGGRELSLILLAGSLVKIGQVLFGKLSSTWSLRLPVALQACELGLIALIILNVQMYVIAQIVIGALMGMALMNRNLVLTEISKRAIAIDGFYNKKTSVEAVGAGLGLLLSSIFSGVISPKNIMLAGTIIGLIVDTPVMVYINTMVSKIPD